MNPKTLFVRAKTKRDNSTISGRFGCAMCSSLCELAYCSLGGRAWPNMIIHIYHNKTSIEWDCGERPAATWIYMWFSWCARRCGAFTTPIYIVYNPFSCFRVNRLAEMRHSACVTRRRLMQMRIYIHFHSPFTAPYPTRFLYLYNKVMGRGRERERDRDIFIKKYPSINYAPRAKGEPRVSLLRVIIAYRSQQNDTERVVEV